MAPVEDGKLAAVLFGRQISTPDPIREVFLEKQKSFSRQISDPGPERQAKLSLVPRTRFARTNSTAALARCLYQVSLEDKKQPPWVLIGAIVVFNVLGKIGDAIGPAMVGSKPLTLLFLNASNTHCILTTTSVAFLPWLIITACRRFCEDPLYFYAGWKYRDACLGMLRAWLPSMADGFDKAESMFKSNLYVAVAVNPGATVCALAGASKMSPVSFFLLNMGSTVGQLLVMRYICLMFPGRVDDALDLIGKYMKILVVITVGITLVGALPMLRKEKQHTD